MSDISIFEISSDIEKFIAFLKTRHRSEEKDIVAISIPNDVAQIILDYSHIALESMTYMISCAHGMDAYVPQTIFSDIFALITDNYMPSCDVKLGLDPVKIHSEHSFILHVTIRDIHIQLILYLTVILNHINHGGSECLSRRIIERHGQMIEIDPISRSGFIDVMNIFYNNIVWVRYSIYDSVTYREAINDLQFKIPRIAWHISVGLKYSGANRRYSIYAQPRAYVCSKK